MSHSGEVKQEDVKKRMRKKDVKLLIHATDSPLQEILLDDVSSLQLPQVNINGAGILRTQL